jgi:hypothetical protein
LVNNGVFLNFLFQKPAKLRKAGAFALFNIEPGFLPTPASLRKIIAAGDEYYRAPVRQTGILRQLRVTYCREFASGHFLVIRTVKHLPIPDVGVTFAALIRINLISFRHKHEAFPIYFAHGPARRRPAGPGCL